jgi:hypothetical protein
MFATHQDGLHKQLAYPMLTKPLYFKSLKRRQMEPASWKDSRLCIKFRITAKKEKEETQAIPATPDSPIATGLQYFPVRNMRWSEVLSYSTTPNTLIGPLPKFHQTGEIFIIGPGISIKYPPGVSMRTTDFTNPFRASTTLSIVSQKGRTLSNLALDQICRKRKSFD